MGRAASSPPQHDRNNPVTFRPRPPGYGDGMGVLARRNAEQERPSHAIMPGVDLGSRGSRDDVPPEAAAAAIDARDVSLWYGTHQVLKSISLGVPELRITAIIGPSGCGKSTLLRCFNRMNDLFPPIRYEGSVQFDGRDVLGPGIDLVELRRRVGMVFQRANPFPMSIYQNVAYGPRLLGVRSRRTLEEAVERALNQAALWNEVKDRLNK